MGPTRSSGATERMDRPATPSRSRTARAAAPIAALVERRPDVAALPFAVIADPRKRLYTEFGVESAKRALMDPRAWPAIVAGVLNSLWGIVRHGRPIPALNPHGGRFGLPADFLIGRQGGILAVKYGQHANDHWPVDQVLALASRERRP